MTVLENHMKKSAFDKLAKSVLGMVLDLVRLGPSIGDDEAFRLSGVVRSVGADLTMELTQLGDDGKILHSWTLSIHP
jgi:hypothetical protein